MPELDESLIRAVCTKVKVGQDPQRALVACGVPGPDASRWLDRGRSEQLEGKTPDDDLCVRLWAAVDIASSDFEATMWASILSASEKGGNYMRFFIALQARYPDRYGKSTVGQGRGHEKRDLRTLEDMVSELDERDKKGEKP
jgi:hypothetical protein